MTMRKGRKVYTSFLAPLLIPNALFFSNLQFNKRACARLKAWRDTVVLKNAPCTRLRRDQHILVPLAYVHTYVSWLRATSACRWYTYIHRWAERGPFQACVIAYNFQSTARYQCWLSWRIFKAYKLDIKAVHWRTVVNAFVNHKSYAYPSIIVKTFNFLSKGILKVANNRNQQSYT